MTIVPVSVSVMESGAPSVSTTSARVVRPSAMKATDSGVRGVLIVRRATLQPAKARAMTAEHSSVTERFQPVMTLVSEWPEAEFQALCSF